MNLKNAIEKLKQLYWLLFILVPLILSQIKQIKNLIDSQLRILTQNYSPEPTLRIFLYIIFPALAILGFAVLIFFKYLQIKKIPKQILAHKKLMKNYDYIKLGVLKHKIEKNYYCPVCLQNELKEFMLKRSTDISWRYHCPNERNCGFWIDIPEPRIDNGESLRRAGIRFPKT